MPMRMYRELSAGRAVAATSIATAMAMAPPHLPMSGLDRFTAERAQPALQPVLEVDLGPPAEDLARPGDVGTADLRIVDRQRFEHDLAGRPGHPDHGLRELEHGHLVIGVAEVHGHVLLARHQSDEAADQVVDVTQ